MTDASLRFYDVDDSSRHGFGDLSIDRDGLSRLMNEHQVGPDEVVIEVGCGAGRLSYIHPRWLGVDLGHPTLVATTPGRSAQGDATRLPIRDEAAAVVITVEALEHVPDPEAALSEIARVLSPGGIGYLRPAWYCSQWPMDPLMRATWTSVSPTDALRKAIRSARYSRVARAPGVLVGKVGTERRRKSAGPQALRWRRLVPDYSAYHTPDADAVASLTPDRVALWFSSRGFEVLAPATRMARIAMTRGPVIVRKPGSRSSGGDPLACPLCHGDLIAAGEVLACRENHRFPVEGDVPRLVPSLALADGPAG